jgi:hypothetical protein
MKSKAKLGIFSKIAKNTFEIDPCVSVKIKQYCAHEQIPV